MDENNSILVGYDLVEIESDAGPYEKGHRWAEPSIPEAANAILGFRSSRGGTIVGRAHRLSTVHCFSARAMRQQNARPSESDSKRARQKVNR